MRLSGRKDYVSEFAETGRDFSEAFKRAPLALNLAWQDILSRYRGSVLGPWWITMMTMSLVLGIGINYSALLHQKIKDLLPFVAIGMVVWGFLNASISEGGDSFVVGSAMIKQSSLPLPLFILRTAIRNLINFAHQVVIIVVVLAWFRIFPGAPMLWALVGMTILMLNLSWVGLMLAMFSSRFRDVPQIVAAVLQLIFFLSPIFWKPPPSLANSIFVAANPFYFSIQSIREPLLHGVCPPQTLTFLLPMAVVGWIITVLVYNQTRRRVVHYL
jgi:ABC-type polysaccharide/polyol phosphate export permease